jgi:hypothetical protein
MMLQKNFATCFLPAICTLLTLFCALPPRADAAPDRSQAEIIRLGERMYREGILPSGAPMQAFIRGDIEVDSSVFSCSSCHLRAGLGSFEGGVITPPTTGNKLYKPYRRPPSLGDTIDQTGRYVYAKTVIERPAYNHESLATALRFGTDPAGQTFNDIMPRYPLDDGDMSILIKYLELLSSEPSPGASPQEFRFATIITDDVSQADRQALLVPLQQFIARKNQQLQMYDDFKKFGYTPTAEMKYAFRKASLDIWELKGAPETWRSQLKAYATANPVFVVLGGISNREWQPIHDFCEAERLPCLFPITAFPPPSNEGWYSYYFNKGFAQEGGAVASYLNRKEDVTPGTTILQIVQDSPTGRALAAGFTKGWHDLERRDVITATLSAEQLHDQDELQTLIKKHKPQILLLWSDAGILPQLPKLAAFLPGKGSIYVSSGYLGKKTATIPESVRERVYITYPYRLTPYVGSKVGGFDSKIPILTTARDFGDRRITSLTTAMLQEATLQGLNLIYDNLYRDHLLDVMSMQMDRTVRDYERFSFGPGQRYVSKGCYIIQLGKGADPALIPRSEWVIQ